MLRISCLTYLFLTTACVLESKGTASDTDPTVATDTEPATDGPATDSSPTEGPATESATDSDSDSDSATDGDTENALPAGCSAPDPDVDASFSLQLAEGWPGASSNQHDIDVDCVVSEVSTGPRITSELLCDVDGEQHVAILEFAAPVLDEDYLAGEPVHLVAVAGDFGDLDLDVFQHIVLRSALDDRLLVVAVRHEQLVPEWFSPLAVDISFPCGEASLTLSPIPMQVNFALPDDATELGLLSGQSGLLSSDLGFAYDIDVKEATTNNCCHFDRWNEVLVRRVVVDG